MKNMKVRAKLLLSFIVVAVLVAVSGIIGIIGLTTLDKNENSMYRQAVTANNASLSRRNIQAQLATSRGAALKQMLKMEYEADLATLDSLAEELDGLIADLDSALTLAVNKERLSAAKTAYAEYASLRASFAGAIRLGNDAAYGAILKDMTAPIDTVVSNLNAISQSAIQLVDEKSSSDSRSAGFLITLLSAAVVLAVSSAIFFAFYISRLISKPLVLLTTFMNKAGSTGDITLRPEDVENIERCSRVKDETGQCISSAASFVKRINDIGKELEIIADGDLTVELPLLSDRDSMGLSLQKMVVNLNSMFNEIYASTTQVSTGSKQIADGAQSLAQGSTEQAAAVEELSSSINEVADKTAENARIAREAADLSNIIKGNAEKGSAQMEQMMQAVKEINDASGQISKVIQVIDNIAFQTNILALNAAVEAARAGQHGRGFAVVAEEVRNLAIKSADAAKDTGSMIENSIEKANFGLSIATGTSASLKEMVDGINRSAEIVTHIARLSDEQTAAIRQINTGIEQVAQVVQQNSATAEESAAASEEMSGQSDMLAQLVSQFKLRDSEYNRHLALPASSRGKALAMPQKAYHAPSGNNSGFGKY